MPVFGVDAVDQGHQFSSYFVLVESSKINIPSKFEILELIKNRSSDWPICWFIAKVASVVCIPSSDFYSLSSYFIFVFGKHLRIYLIIRKSQIKQLL
ncbi:hypothetical protein H4Q26_008001 [Puccinia striiformis f. sp. tritici PST-130]|nr:hypothetical protein H4Q26_008001 [Puccinia striiformis f. sp. tritici PST-130]